MVVVVVESSLEMTPGGDPFKTGGGEETITKMCSVLDVVPTAGRQPAAGLARRALVDNVGVAKRGVPA